MHELTMFHTVMFYLFPAAPVTFIFMDLPCEEFFSG